jgi:pimeloyl-ACP methyl ester carboxylesterase
VHVVIHLPTTGGWYDLDLRGRDLLSAIGAYAGTDYTRALPQALEELARGDTVRRPISPELVLHVVHETAIARTAGPNYPVIYHIMLCGDIPSGVLQAGGRGICDALGVPFGGPDAIAPVTSDAPTLLLSSEYDAQTPPDMAEEASRTLSHGYRVLFPGVGHLAYARLMTAPCVAVIVNAFLLDTSHQPPDPCSRTLLPSFLPRSADLILVPR